MRINLQQLCGINSKELMFLSHPEASKRIIDACYTKKQELAMELHEITTLENKDYENLSQINYKILYLDRAIESRIQDYEEMELSYER